jgi:folate-binding protein YgfZ
MTVTALDQTRPKNAAELDSLRAEFEALRLSCGAYELNERARVAITGGDRLRWLNGMVTNNICDLAEGHGVYAFLLNPQGHIQADLYAYNRGDSLVVETDRALLEKILQVFNHYIIMDDVELTNATDQFTGIGIAGPKAETVLRTLGIALPQLVPLQFIELRWRDAGVVVVKGDNPSVESLSLWVEQAQAASLRGALAEAGAAPVGRDALELLRIASGIPRYGQDIRERDLPQETEQQRALNFNKGCYIGQEIVERIRSRGSVHRKFSGFEIEGPLPSPGAKLQLEGKDVGEITSAALLPAGDGNRAVALGYVRREFGAPGQQLSIGDVKATVSDLPFKCIFDGAS